MAPEHRAKGSKTLASKKRLLSIEALRCGPVPHKQRTVPPQRCTESPQRALEPRRRRARRRAVETAYNRCSAKTVCATRRARRRVTEPCAEPPRASVLQPTPLRVGTSSAPRSAAAKPLKYYDGPFLSRERCRPAAPAHCRSAKAREHTSPEAINTNSSTSRHRH